MDFSHAGYKGGGVTLPYVPAKLTVHPLGEDTDCTDYIQQAIDMVSALPQDADGFRGAVLLAPGRYVCERTIQIKADGVVLRGSGSDPSGSVIVMRGGKHTAIVVNNGTRQRAGNRIGDVSSAVQLYTELHGYGVVRALTGHGIGHKMHEAPEVPNFGKRGTGAPLKAGLCICIEPMITAGDWRVIIDRDGWTVRTADRKNAAHYENTVIVTDGEPEILTL